MPTASVKPNPPGTVSLPAGIEIFKAGKAIADDGTAYEFTDAQIADMARVYDPALREAPLCIGHPAADKPACAPRCMSIPSRNSVSFARRKARPRCSRHRGRSSTPDTYG